MSLRTCMMIIVLMVCVGSVICAKPKKDAPPQGGGTTVFSSPLQRGQYIFLGQYTGTKVKNKKWEQGVTPRDKVRISTDATSEKWDLQIAVQSDTGENGEKVWKWEANWRKNDPDGSMNQRYSRTWQTTLPGDKKVEEVPIEKVDASEEIGIEGLQFYKIPYAKVEEEVHYVVVAFADEKDLFPKAITIPRKYILWSWDKWFTLE